MTVTAASTRTDVAVGTPLELSSAERESWQTIIAGQAAYRSPFLTPAFAQAVAEVRRDCRLAVITTPDGRQGFFAFHAGRSGAGRPLGRKLADHQAVVADPALPLAPTELVRACGLRTFSFDHLVAGLGPFFPWIDEVQGAARIDVGRPGGDPPREAARKRRRLEREGDLRFTWHDSDPGALRTLLAWKSAQYRRTGAADVTARPWVVELLERLAAQGDPQLSVVLSTLRLDERLIAVHYALRTGALLHSWFPAYDAALARHSPGLVLLASIVHDAPTQGIGVIDLGKGGESYKARFANAAVPVASGTVSAEPIGAIAHRVAGLAFDLAHRTRLGPTANRLRRRVQLG